MRSWLRRLEERYPSREVLPNGRRALTWYQVAWVSAGAVVGWAMGTALAWFGWGSPPDVVQSAMWLVGVPAGGCVIVGISRLRARRPKPRIDRGLNPPKP